MPFYIARCQWRDGEAYTAPVGPPDAWALLDEEFYSLDEARQAANDDQLQQMQQRGSWMGVHRIGLQRIDYHVVEADDFELALVRARDELGAAVAGGALVLTGDTTTE